MLRSLKDGYARHRLAFQLLAFACGFIFDAIAATGHGPDHLVLIGQQAAYLLIIGAILYGDLLHSAHAMRLGPRLERLWRYRDLVVHFCLGTLINLYSIFFLLSASFSSSIVFVLVLFAAIGLNEFAGERAFGVDIKVGLFVICVFCFLSLLLPIAVGHVGILPTVTAVLGTLLVVALFFWRLRRRLEASHVRRRLLRPAAAIIVCFITLEALGFVPPVPIAARRLGVYHGVDRQGDAFVLSYQRPWWKFWQTSEEPFLAEPGDRVYVFTSIFSPARFDDTVMIRWSHRDPTSGWSETDRLPLHFTGGHETGFRAYTWKDHYLPGDWRVAVETTTGVEIARLTFSIVNVPVDPGRTMRRRLG